MTEAAAVDREDLAEKASEFLLGVLERMGEAILAGAAIAALTALWIFRTRPALLSRGGHLLARLVGRPGWPIARRRRFFGTIP